LFIIYGIIVNVNKKYKITQKILLPHFLSVTAYGAAYTVDGRIPLSLLKHNGGVRAAGDAAGRALSRRDAQLAFLYDAVFGRLHASVRAGEYAGVAADAFVFIDGDNAVRFRQRACYAAFDAIRLRTVAAGDGEADLIARVLLDMYARVYFHAAQSARHIGLARRRERAVILAEMTAETPFFVYVNSFHW
jgi:hypothetical protein